MRATLLLVLLALPAAAQVFPGGGGGSGGTCTLDSTQTGIATYFRATTTTGTGYQCDAMLASCVDLGPGLYNYLGTNVAGDILLGPAAGNNATVRVAGSAYISNVVQVTGSVDVYGNSATLNNSFPNQPLRMGDGEGLQIVGQTALAVCSSTIRNALKTLTFAVNSGTVDRLCWCRSANDNAVAASATHRWVNVVSGSVGATDTECPP